MGEVCAWHLGFWLYTQPSWGSSNGGGGVLEFCSQFFCQNPGSGSKNGSTQYSLSSFFLLLSLPQVTVISPQKHRSLRGSSSSQVDFTVFCRKGDAGPLSLPTLPLLPLSPKHVCRGSLGPTAFFEVRSSLFRVHRWMDLSSVPVCCAEVRFGRGRGAVVFVCVFGLVIDI